MTELVSKLPNGSALAVGNILTASTGTRLRLVVSTDGIISKLSCKLLLSSNPWSFLTKLSTMQSSLIVLMMLATFFAAADINCIVGLLSESKRSDWDLLPEIFFMLLLQDLATENFASVAVVGMIGLSSVLIMILLEMCEYGPNALSRGS